MTCHGARQGLEALGIVSNDEEALVSRVVGEVPVATRREVVVDGDPRGLRRRQKAVDAMATAEARPAHQEVLTATAQRSDSQCVPRRCSSGWLTSRCQTTAHS